MSTEKKGSGILAGSISCGLAILGVFTFGTIFVPIATIVTLFGSIIALKNKNIAGIGVNALAWVLILVGLFTSPVLMNILGIIDLKEILNTSPPLKN